MSFKKSLTALIVAGGMLTVAGPAAAFPEFTVNPNTFIAGEGGSVNPFVADKIIGNYFEVITFGAGTFDISLAWTGSQFANTNLGTAYNGTQTGLGNNYGLYATFLGTGTWSTSMMGVTTFLLNPGGDLQVWFDKDNDTSSNGYVVNGSTLWGFSGTGDDINIADGVGTKGTGNLTCNNGNNCGSFGQESTFSLKNGGDNFFVLPNPFYAFSLQNGQFNGFSVAAGDTQKLNGSADVEFTNPEPTAIALVGIALIGMGLARRRKA